MNARPLSCSVKEGDAGAELRLCRLLNLGLDMRRESGARTVRTVAFSVLRVASPFVAAALGRSACERLGPASVLADASAGGCRGKGKDAHCISFAGEGVATGDENAEGKGCVDIGLSTTWAVMISFRLLRVQPGVEVKIRVSVCDWYK